jgi:hypothetical protein
MWLLDFTMLVSFMLYIYIKFVAEQCLGRLLGIFGQDRSVSNICFKYKKII